MKLIDANIVVYARGVRHPYRDSCRRVLEDAASGNLECCLSVEVLQEIMNIYHRRGRTSEAVNASKELLVLLPVVLDVTVETMKLAIETLAAYPHLQSRDAVHAATVKEHKLEGLISTDRAFDSIVGLTRFDPMELGQQV